MTGVVILLAALAASAAFGVWRTRTDGVVRPTGTALPPAPVEPNLADKETAMPGLVDADALGHPLGARATLLQFSSAFCQPCRLTRVVLADVAATQDGVEHVELDAESHLGLVRRLGVMRTPTVLILDANGREVGRAAGAPRKQQVLDALRALAVPSQP
jgi:thiol-disulfide isomerase/thioredoxin